MSYTLGNVLDSHDYGYSYSQNQDVLHLLDIAGGFDLNFALCIGKEIDLNPDLNNLLEILSKLKEVNDSNERRQTLNNIKFDNFTDAHKFFIKLTQELFFKRSGERWEAKSPDWITSHEQEVLSIARNLGLCDTVIPKETSYDCLAVFGASSGTMQKRLDYSYQIIRQNSLDISEGIFLLTGERYVTTGIDNSTLIELARNHFSTSKVTESHLMEIINLDYQNQYDLNHINYFVIDTPKGDKSRPNTDDTLIQFFDTYEDKCSNVVFVSNNPYINSQKESVYNVVTKKNVHVSYEVVGDGCDYDALNPHPLLMSAAATWFKAWDRIEYSMNNNNDASGMKTLGYTNRCG